MIWTIPTNHKTKQVSHELTFNLKNKLSFSAIEVVVVEMTDDGFLITA